MALSRWCPLVLFLSAFFAMVYSAAAMFFAAEPESFRATSVPSKLILTICSAASPELVMFGFLLSLVIFVLTDFLNAFRQDTGTDGNIAT